MVPRSAVNPGTVNPGAVTPPAVNRRIIEALLGDELPHAPHRLVLVHGRYEDSSPAEFCIDIDGVPRRIRVTDQPSVLGIVEAWQEHQATSGSDVLVVTTGVDDAQLGWDLRGHALHRSTRTVDRSKIVAHRFGAVEADPRIRREGWLVEALLDAEPTSGWPRCGSVLTRDFAVQALIEARLGGPDLADSTFGAGALDADALLAWSRTSVGPARFAALSDAERAGMTGWLTEMVGDVAPVLLGLAGAGRGADAMALGVLGSVLVAPGVGAEAALAFGGLFGDLRFRPAQLRAFTAVVEGTLERWCAEAESTRASDSEGNRQRVLDVVERADELATAADLTEALATNRFLPSGLQARLRTVTGALSTRSRVTVAAVAAAETALGELLKHRLAGLYPRRLRAARMAVRLGRWLATPDPAVTSVAAGVRQHLNEWGWVDRALIVLWAGDPVGDPVVGEAYRALHEAARARRDALDEAFARRLVTWTENA
ncbi:MAG: BREX-2 system phosphatase PglZ, partial [Pseudonocardiaceae bacterium]